jgi:VanZ family protein
LQISRLMFFPVLAVSLYFLLRFEPPPEFFLHSDKAFHVLGFASLVLLAGLAFCRRQVCMLRLTLAIALLSIVLEGLQATDWLPLRYFSWLDLSANLFGCLIGLALLIIGRRKAVPA